MSYNSLTSCQQKAADAFFDFLHSDDKYFLITGPAGTGKTHLMGYLSQHGYQEYVASCKMLGEDPAYTHTLFTATTNKAAECLSNATKQSVNTIHSAIGLKPMMDYSTGKSYLQRTKAYVRYKGFILFVDEASMIDEELYKEIEYATPESKVVFVGDHAQLAPINESISHVFTKTKQENIASLLTPVRNADQPALMDLCNQLRASVESGTFSPIKEVEGVIDYISEEEMYYGFDLIFQDHDPSCRILCYTNSRVEQFNTYIRKDVRKLATDFAIGDIVVAGDSWASGPYKLVVEGEYQIIDVEYNKTASFSNIHKGVALNEHIPYMAIRLKRIGWNEPSFVVPVANDRNDLLDRLKKYSRKKAWHFHYSIKEYFGTLRDKSSCTVYKAQGSTYDSVFVDLGNIGKSFDPEQVARLIYVAISRARTRVYLCGSLPGKYHDSRGKQQWEPWTPTTK